MPKIVHVPIGFRSDRLEVKRKLIVEGASWRQRRTVYECLCDCGKIVVVEKGSRLLSRHVKSCGCLQKENQDKGNVTHGMSGTKEWEAWRSMIGRCHNEGRSDYESYGARGIVVCERWRDSFESFYEDMGPAPTKAHSIDRIDNDGNYEPSNCRWATMKEQCRNRRSCRFLDVEGEIRTVEEWSEISGIGRNILTTRYEQGKRIKTELFAPRNFYRFGNQNARKRR